MINFTFFEIKIPGAKVLNSIGKSEFDKENIDEVTNFNTKPKSLTQVRNVAHGPDCLVGKEGRWIFRVLSAFLVCVRWLYNDSFSIPCHVCISMCLLQIHCFRACLSFPLPVYLNYGTFCIWLDFLSLQILWVMLPVMDLLMVQFVHFVVNVPYHLFFPFMLVV